MTSRLKILSPGLLCSIQDKGRIGMGGYGVPRSGAADPVALRMGNALVGNDPYEAAMEFRILGPQIVAERGSVRIGLAANAIAQLSLAESKETQTVSPWQTVTLNEGDLLAVSPLKDDATGYITVEGGLLLDPVLGSCSTYGRAKLGGLNGQPLKAGDILSAKVDRPAEKGEKTVAEPFKTREGPLRIILGPQDDYFSTDEIERFCSNSFTVSSNIDRMGVRLEGLEVQTLPEKGNDLISDGLIPGAIQVPGNGQPIILFVDCQTVGGYPKIATVITADLHRLGQLRPGQEVRFEAVDLAQAQTALIGLENSIAASIASLQNLENGEQRYLAALHHKNLISGVVDVLSPEPSEGDS